MYAIPIRSIPPYNNNDMEINSFALQLNCHQCRKKKDFSAICKNPRDGKPCVLKFCHNCLDNRYGEKIVEVYNLNDWVCPRCRGICNCSVCKKNKDQEPTDQSRQTGKRKSQGGNKGLKTYHNKTKNARRNELQEVCNDSNTERKRNQNDKLKSKVEETDGQMDGPEAWGANDYFFDPSTFSSYTFLPNPFILDFKKKCVKRCDHIKLSTCYFCS